MTIGQPHDSRFAGEPIPAADNPAPAADSKTTGRSFWRRRSARRSKPTSQKRQLLSQSLEPRQLLAGPDLLGIEPNVRATAASGAQLLAGSNSSVSTQNFNPTILTSSPRELTFRFDDASGIDPATIGTAANPVGISVTRQGDDGRFESAKAITDFGTTADPNVPRTLMQFRSERPGIAGNGLTVMISAVDRGPSGMPVVVLPMGNGTGVTLSLNSNLTRPATLRDIELAVNADANDDGRTDNGIIRAIPVSGSPVQPVARTAALRGGPITVTLSGANSAEATTDLGTADAVRLRVVADRSGAAGQGTTIEVVRQNRGLPTPPSVSVTGNRIRVVIDSAPTPTTVGQFIDAINAVPAAAALVDFTLEFGSRTTPIGNAFAGLITLSGANDTVVPAGFIGPGETPGEIVFRFAEPLPEDIYQVEVFGSGARALRGLDGEAFNDGADFATQFIVNTPAQVLAVVPQPVSQAADGRRTQQLNAIDVYFTDDVDDSILNSSFYQLIYTRDTVTSNDDEVFTPDGLGATPAVARIPGEPSAVRLTFSSPLGARRSVANPSVILGGSIRLRVGNNDVLDDFQAAGSSRPQVFTPANDTTDNFTGILGGATADDARLPLAFAAGQKTAVRVTGQRIENPAETVVLQYPGGSDFLGVRNIRPGDPTRLADIVPLDIWRAGADSLNGITTAYYNFPSQASGATGVFTNLARTEDQRDRFREAIALFSEYLGVQFIEIADTASGVVTVPDDGPLLSFFIGDLDIIGGFGGQSQDDAVLTGATGNADPDEDRAVVVARRGLLDSELPRLAGTDLPIQSQSFLTVVDNRDVDESVDDATGGELFRAAMLAVGQALGYGFADHLPQPITQSSRGILDPFTPASPDRPELTSDLPVPNEALFPSPSDITNGQYLHRPDSNDIDLYRFDVPAGRAGVVSIETIAERLPRASSLDTNLRLWRQTGATFTEIAANDDYFSNDSRVQMRLSSGVYVIGVTATGNTDYDPVVENTGMGGRTEGSYELLVSFDADASASITDGPVSGAGAATDRNLALDGDADGEAGGEFNYFFKPAIPATVNATESRRTVFVDNDGSFDAAAPAPGAINNPFREIDQAITFVNTEIARLEGLGIIDADEIQFQIRVLPGGTYRVGRDLRGIPFADGLTIDVPERVDLVIDAGVRIEMQRARISAGSTTQAVDRSGSSLQVLGTPSNPVVLTGTGANTPGTWAGIELRADIDAGDLSRPNPAADGIFLNHIQYAAISGAGGLYAQEGAPRAISPIQIGGTRPTIMNNTITGSAGAAIAASPLSFEETTFNEPRFQNRFAPGAGTASTFVPDYDRVGPHIRGNMIANNSINGLAIGISTSSAGILTQLETNARLDDIDIVHVLTENLLIEGRPGGLDASLPTPSIQLTSGIQGGPVGQIPTGSYVYRVTFVDAQGFESGASPIAPLGGGVPVTTAAGTTGSSIVLSGLPTVPSDRVYTGRRLYRSVAGANDFRLVAELDTASTSTVDTQRAGTRPLDPGAAVAGRLDPSLVADPGIVLKADSSRIDVSFGAHLYAEGTPELPIVMTSLSDNRFGVGGSFRTSNSVSAVMRPGDYSGIQFSYGAEGSFDNLVMAGAGGESRIEGGFASFNPIEIIQSELRIANSRFEMNANGRTLVNDSGNTNNNPNDPRETRVGRSTNASGTIFVRGAQPVIVGNTFESNSGPVITADLNSFTFEEVIDRGRQTGTISSIDDTARLAFPGNAGPLLAGNMINVVAGGAPTSPTGPRMLAGVEVRGGAVATGLVFDDTDIVHIVRDTITIPNQHIYGGLRLESDARGSLVVKFDTLGDTPEQVIGISRIQTTPLANLPQFGDPGFTPDVTFTEPGIDPPTPQLPTRIDAGFEVGANFISVNFNEEAAGTFTNTEPFGVLISAQFDLGSLDQVTVDPFGTTLVGFTQDRIIPVPGGVYLDLRGLSFNPTDVVRVRTGELFPEVEEPFEPDALRRSTAAIVAGGNLFTAEDQFIDINDRIGGSLQVVGQPDFPVVLTSLQDDTIGAGFTSDGRAVLDTNNNGVRLNPDGSAIVGLTADDANGLQGSWDGLTIREAASDSNAQVSGENEPANLGIGNDTNSTPGSAQFLGRLAASEAAGDEFNRLGLIVEGQISAPGDEDVYSFFGQAGSQIYLDIDRTDGRLDTIVELIDANGNTIALSDDSAEEARLFDMLSAGGTMAAQARLNANRLERRIGVNAAGVQRINPTSVVALDGTVRNPSLGEGIYGDAYSTNPKDAGLSIVLPGTTNQTFQYFVRVRSGSTAATEQGNRGNQSFLASSESLNRGLTTGAYQLQIRVTEEDITPGTQVRFADVRFASNGVQIIGGPIHSPLIGEDYEVARDNDTLATAQRLGLYNTQNPGFSNGVTFQVNREIINRGVDAAGNDLLDIDLENNAGPLSSDRLAKSIGGSLSSSTDVDWYRFDIDYEQLTRGEVARYLSTVFDIDYAAGLGRADLTLHVFNESGGLVLIGGDSNIIDDQQAIGGTLDNRLDTGSSSVADPFIGAAELLAGTYYVAVSLQGNVPIVLDQFTNAASASPLLRVEPLDSIQRIAEEHFGGPSRGTAGFPDVPVLFDPVQSVVPQSLDDVRLFVNSEGALRLVNPFTGQNYGTLGGFSGNTSIRDVSFTANGELFGYTVGTNNTQYVRIDSATGATTPATGAVGNAGLQTFTDTAIEPPIVTATGAVIPVQQLLTPGDTGDQLTIEAITINAGAGNSFFVGNRPGLQPGVKYATNILFPFNPATGQALGPANNLQIGTALGDATPLNAALSLLEIGQIDTTVRDTEAFNTLGLSDASVRGPGGTLVPRIVDGDTFTIDNNGTLTTFEFEQGDTLRVLDPATVNSGASITAGPATNRQTVVLSLDPGAVNPGGANPNRVGLGIDRTESPAELASRIADVFATRGISVTTLGPQVRFANGNDLDVVATAGLAQTGTQGVTTGNVPIALNLTDTAEELAARIVDRINNPAANEPDNTATNPTVTAGLNAVVFQAAVTQVTSDNGGLAQGGGRRGGTVTGIELIGGVLFAVTDAGELYRVDTPNVIQAGNFRGDVGTLVNSATDLAQFNFTGLRRGPTNITGPTGAGSSLSNLLFGTTTSGLLVAFDTNGVLQPVFAGGVSSIPIGGSVVGLDFSTLDFNLFHLTNRRNGDAGHGIPGLRSGLLPNADLVQRVQVGGGNSIAFSFEPGAFGNRFPGGEAPVVTDGTGVVSNPRQDGQIVANTLNFPGGASGAIQSSPFSLAGYAAEDQPYLYFSYFLGTDAVENQDTIRVYVVDSVGGETLVATNNLNTGNGAGANDGLLGTLDDELGAAGFFTGDGTSVAQPLFDNTGSWRQARVPLGQFAGQEGLTLRYEFATDGRRISSTGGLIAAPGSTIANSIALGDNVTLNVAGQSFTFTLSPSLQLPSGGQLAAAYANPALAGQLATLTIDGQVFVLTDGTQMVGANQFEINLLAGRSASTQLSDLTAADVASAVQSAILGLIPLQRLAIPGFQLEQILARDGFFDVRIGDTTFVFADLPDDATAQVRQQAIQAALDAAPNVGTGQRIVVDLLEEFNFNNPGDRQDSLQPLSQEQVAEVLVDLINTFPQAQFGLVDLETDFDLDQLVPTAADLTAFYADSADAFDITIDGVNYVLNNNGADASLNSVPPRTLSADQVARVNAALPDQPPVTDATELTDLTPEARDVLNIVLVNLGNPIVADIAGRLRAAIDGVAGNPMIQFGSEPFAFTDTSDRNNTPAVRLATATPLTFADGTAYSAGNVTFTGDGRLGAVNETATADVDLFQVDLAAGTMLTVTAALTGRPGAVAVRIFDPSGAEIASGIGAATLILDDDQTVFIGFSGAGNTDYDPTTGAVGSNGDAGVYTASVMIRTALTIVDDGAELEVAGTRQIVGSPAFGIIAPAQPAVDGIAVPILRSSTPAEVAAALQRALADRFSDGNTTVFPVAGTTVKIGGLSIDDPGPLGLQTDVIGDLFGPSSTGGAPDRTAGADDNEVEGFFLDDIIIGFAERGESVTNSLERFDPFTIRTPAEIAAVTTFTGVPTSLGSPTQGNFPSGFGYQLAPGLSEFTSAIDGEYQLEIRDASEYVASATVGRRILDDGSILVSYPPDARFRTFDTNDRLAAGVILRTLPAAAIADGGTFTISDANSRLTFEFDILPLGANPVSNGVGDPANVVVQLNAADSAEQVAEKIIAAINSPQVSAILDGGAQRANGTRQIGGIVGTLDDRVVLSSSLRFAPDPSDRPTFDLIETPSSELRGDDNRDRLQQGVISIENTQFVYNAGAGVSVSRQARENTIGEAGAATPTVLSYARNLPTLNTENLIPGVVIRNNVMALNGEVGLRIQGLTNGQALENPVGFDRIVNNTIVGGTITAGLDLGPQTFRGILFDRGGISFADAVINLNLGSDVAALFANPEAALGAPDAGGIGPEPTSGLTTLSLGTRGSATFVFGDNLLTTDGTPAADLVIFESGRPEEVGVEVSVDGVSFTSVGTVFGAGNTIDLDAFGFTPTDRLSFVRLTDRSPSGTLDFGALGADIDAVGAISTTPRSTFVPGQNGVEINQNSAPTLLNNILANLQTGLIVGQAATDVSDDLTVIGATTYYGNVNDLAAGSTFGRGASAQQIPSTLELFVDPAGLVFAPQSGAPIVDSGIDLLLERASLAEVRRSVGLPLSPVRASEVDLNGQLRVDDPRISNAGGVGFNAFIDRGAAERRDDTGPRVTVSIPRASDLGTTLAQTVTGRADQPFEFQLIDNLAPVDVSPGVGINDSTVDSSLVRLTQTGANLAAPRVLAEGTDYIFAYEPGDNTIRLTPTAGVWEQNSSYTIEIIGNQVTTADNGVTNVLRLQPGELTPDGAVTRVGDLRLEADTGIQLSVVAADLRMIDPVTGVSVSTLEAQTVTISDGRQNPDGTPITVTFEFDTEAIDAEDNVAPGNVKIRIPPGATPQRITTQLAAAINASALRLIAIPLDTATALNNTARLQLLGVGATAEASFVSLPDTSFLRQVNQNLQVQLNVTPVDDGTGDGYNGQQFRWSNRHGL